MGTNLKMSPKAQPEKNVSEAGNKNMFTCCLAPRLWMNAAFSLWGQLVSHTVVCWRACESDSAVLNSRHRLLLSLSVLLLVPRLNISDSDMLTITDGDEVATRILGRYVGGSSPFKLFSTTPDLTVTFHSDPAGLVFGKGEGFIINYMGECNYLQTIH